MYQMYISRGLRAGINQTLRDGRFAAVGCRSLPLKSQESCLHATRRSFLNAAIKVQSSSPRPVCLVRYFYTSSARHGDGALIYTGNITKAVFGVPDSNSYTWTDGWPVFFTRWGPGEPTNHAGGGCVSMQADARFHGTWNDTACESAKPYICKISSEPIPPTPAPGDGKCLPGWVPFGRYCYFVYNPSPQAFSWPEARHYCQLAKGDLVSVHSRADVEFMRNLSRIHNVWIGLTRDGNFGWSWTDGTSLGFVNWVPGEPNDVLHPGSVGTENCVEMYPDGRWNDNNCVQKRGFACRHRQYYTTDDNGGIVIPTDAPVLGDDGAIAGAVIGAIVVITLLLGLLYYVFTVRGVKLSPISFPTRTAAKDVDVPAFNNPNFGGESET